ncbi:hypothetical protein SADUNF_Sadunf17G0040700 [Salix dunnii]|uniref:Uncharacterized protein n=1 Tax=Salix dunnii TaxID=1413687 RepID=A0A835MEM0_9ROSI|nr:hypothetical protein SADUNF_Sadunf17G0040700 [Salix dunnii]
MISAKKIIKLARKWQKLAAIRRKRITLPQPFERTDASSCSTSSTTEKGHFVVYSTDQKRFLLPLEYLNNNIVRDLLKIAEEEFGLPSDGPLTLPSKCSMFVSLPCQFNELLDTDHWLLIYKLEGRILKEKLSRALDFRVLNAELEMCSIKHLSKMISTQKLIKLARKWQKLAAIRRKGITLPPPIGRTDASICSTSSTAEKGHFVVYSADHKRFLLPLEYLDHGIVRELLIIAEEEFGLPGNGPLTLPCDSDLMDYVVSLITSHVTRDVQRALLLSIASSHCSLSLDLHSHQTSICSF